jgi:outer membrane lipoprotein-sorting protein
MFRRSILAGIAALPVLVSGTWALAQALSLDDVSRYLNGLKTAKGSFVQINADGSRSKGTFYLHRPGRMRFEYDPPNPALVVSSGGKLAIFDKKSNFGPQQYPLSKTPLNLILKRRVNLKAEGLVSDVTIDDESISFVAQDPRYRDYGSIKLVFSANPVRLQQWVVTDQAGRKTTVMLGEMEKGLSLSPNLFSIVQIAEKLGQD